MSAKMVEQKTLSESGEATIGDQSSNTGHEILGNEAMVDLETLGGFLKNLKENKDQGKSTSTEDAVNYESETANGCLTFQEEFQEVDSVNNESETFEEMEFESKDFEENTSAKMVEQKKDVNNESDTFDEMELDFEEFLKTLGENETDQGSSTITEDNSAKDCLTIQNKEVDAANVDTYEPGNSGRQTSGHENQENHGLSHHQQDPGSYSSAQQQGYDGYSYLGVDGNSQQRDLGSQNSSPQQMLSNNMMSAVQSQQIQQDLFDLDLFLAMQQQFDQNADVTQNPTRMINGGMEQAPIQRNQAPVNKKERERTIAEIGRAVHNVTNSKTQICPICEKVEDITSRNTNNSWRDLADHIVLTHPYFSEKVAEHLPNNGNYKCPRAGKDKCKRRQNEPFQNYQTLRRHYVGNRHGFLISWIDEWLEEEKGIRVEKVDKKVVKIILLKEE